MGMYWCMQLECSRGEPIIRCCWIEKASMDVISILFLSLPFSLVFPIWAVFLHLVAFEFEGTRCKSLSKFHGRDKVTQRQIITAYVPELDGMCINKATFSKVEIF